ncbi:MAG: PHP domain-containing protein [Bacteroidota bacterium]|nr:PHP domain-containing protein [Bacteroidota bacterium]
MEVKINYKGTRWFKCDLHLHTVASLCFQDRNISSKEWVERAILQGLDCVAVTDHNTSKNIDDIKSAAEGTTLTVFPGVEITCDASKVHLLVLFDVSKTSSDIRDFLVRADVRAEDFGKQNASTVKSIFEIAELASKDGALVIPAHIDEYNGLGSVSVGNLKKFFSEYNINAVQVVHKEFLNSDLQTSGNVDFKAKLNNYYNNPDPAIDDSKVKEWFTPVKYAIEANLAILTFSDNPHEPKNSKHGLWGIGSHYTWIKMDEVPSLEGLRQAFLLPEYRIENEFVSPNNPYNSPDLWIKSISIVNTTITENGTPLKIDFNPQLNTIIGGRGSGKSSVLRFIRGVFNRIIDLHELEEILSDHNNFYKRESGRPKKGVLTENSEIEIEFVRNNFLNKIKALDITNSKQQKIIIERFDDYTSSWEIIADEGYIDFFEYEHYSQKQIYEIAQEPNALRERIDKAIDGIDQIKREREQLKNQFLEKSASIRTIGQLISGKGKIETKIKDLDANIKKLQQSGIAELLTSKEKFSKEEEALNEFKSKIEEKENAIQSLINTFEIQDIVYSNFNEIHQNELKAFSQSAIDGMQQIKSELDILKDKSLLLKSNFEESLNNTQWRKDYSINVKDFNTKKLELEKEGINYIANFEKLTQEKAELEKEIENIDTKAIIKNENIAERLELQIQFTDFSKQISKKRSEFINSILQDGKVKINIKSFRNHTDYETRLRKILQREGNTFQSDIDELMKICFNGNVEQKLKEVREVFFKIRNGEDVSNVVSGHFVKLVNSLNDAQIDEIELLLPEDEIEVQYKPTPDSAFKSLSTASAGQKTTAILTFILSYGKVPLILDQPEDDLDNRLVYDLIVDRLKHAKKKRQIIVVTHNANVPVNGDAELIISMDTNSKNLKVLNTGTVEQELIKKEICSIMEGGEIAFEMRSKRYKQIRK